MKWDLRCTLALPTLRPRHRLFYGIPGRDAALKPQAVQEDRWVTATKVQERVHRDGDLPSLPRLVPQHEEPRGDHVHQRRAPVARPEGPLQERKCTVHMPPPFATLAEKAPGEDRVVKGDGKRQLDGTGHDGAMAGAA